MGRIKSLTCLCFVCLFLIMACADHDKTAWVEASKQNSVEGYQAYTQLFPNGKYFKEAQSKIELLTPKAPDCNDERIRTLVFKIAEENPGALFNASTCQLANIRITGFDKAIGKYECAANAVDGQGHTMGIVYTSELSNEGKEFYVTASPDKEEIARRNAIASRKKAAQAWMDEYSRNQRQNTRDYFARKNAAFQSQFRKW